MLQSLLLNNLFDFSNTQNNYLIWGEKANPVYPKISIHNFHTLLYSFPMVLIFFDGLTLKAS